MTRFSPSIVLALILLLVRQIWANPNPANQEKEIDLNSRSEVSSTTAPEVYETLISPEAWPIVVSGSVAGLCIVGGLIMAYYYIVYVDYYRGTAVNSKPIPIANYYYGPSDGRAMEGRPSVWEVVMESIELGQQLYGHLQKPGCTEKHLCEVGGRWPEYSTFQQSISRFYSILVSNRVRAIIEMVPMPRRMKEELVADWEEKRFHFHQGKNSKGCTALYPRCSESYREIIVRFLRRHELRYRRKME